MAHGIGRMPLAPEMYVFQAEVGGDQRLVSPRKRQHRTVVADAPAGTVIPCRRGATDAVESATFRLAATGPLRSQPNIPEATSPAESGIYYFSISHLSLIH